MALIGNNADTLLNGLSSFWHRFFRDTKDIQAAYEGTEILLGQVYLNFMSDVLNTSVIEAPLFRKEYYKLISVRSDQVKFLERGVSSATPPAVPDFYGNPGIDRYVATVDTPFGYIPTLQNLVYAPTASLEQGVDYGVSANEIHFIADPTVGLNGYATRELTVEIGGKFYSSTLTDWSVAGVQKGDTLYYSETIDLGTVPPFDQTSPAFAAWLALQDGARMATVVDVSGPMLSVSADTAIPSFPAGAEPVGFSWRVMRQREDGTYNTSLPRESSLTDGKVDYTTTLQVKEVSFWAVDARVDDRILYKNYGYFFTDEQASSESYRSLIRGLMQLYILGPAMARLESALNLTAGLATILTDGEILTDYDSGVSASGSDGALLAGDIFETTSATFDALSVGGYVIITNSDYPDNLGTFNIQQYISPTQVRLKPVKPFSPDTLLSWKYSRTNFQTVVTSANTYTYPLNTPMRADVIDPANKGVLTFQVFESLTAAIQVTDYVQDPQWWHSITIPEELVPDKDIAWRTVTSNLYPNIVGPLGQGQVGDPGFYVGRDEDGHNPANPYRHKASFILMDRFLKMHMFAVLVDSSVSLTPILVNDLQILLRDVKPVHTALYFRPLSTLKDVINVSESLRLDQALRKILQINVLNNALQIGSPWLIGDAWKFANPAGGTILTAIADGITDGVYGVIGGLDPTIQPADVTASPPASNPDLQLLSRPLYVHMHP